MNSEVFAGAPSTPKSGRLAVATRQLYISRLNTILAQDLAWDNRCVICHFQKSHWVEGWKKVGNDLIDFEELLDILRRLSYGIVKLRREENGRYPEHLLGFRQMHNQQVHVKLHISYILMFWSHFSRNVIMG